MLTLGLCWNLNKRLSPDAAGATALGAAEAGPDRSLVRRGIGKGMRMTWAEGKRLNAHAPEREKVWWKGCWFSQDDHYSLIHPHAVPPSSVDHPSFTQRCLTDVCVHVTWLLLSAEGCPASTEQSTCLRKALLPTQPGRFQHSPSSY